MQRRPDAVVLDIDFSGRITGYDVARRIRRCPEGANVLLVALTGYAAPADQRRALAAGFDKHVAKPVDPVVLGQLLGQARGPPPG